MSCYEWETARITLPAASVAPLKRTLSNCLNTTHSEVYQLALELHRPLAKLTPVEYRNHLRNDTEPSGTDTRTMAVELLRHKSYLLSVRRPTHADVDRWAPRATGRSTNFPAMDLQGCEAASIGIVGQELSWHVEENNHAVENAHETPLARILFAELEQMDWPEGTGGYGVGNNEYHADSGGLGGGGNYKTFAYGPLGITETMLQLQH
jgi:hypothetical protein